MPLLAACSIQEGKSRCLRSRTIERKAESQGIGGLNLRREGPQRIELASTQWSRSGQRRLWRLPEVLADGIASYTKFFPNLAQAHPGGMQFLHPLIQFPFPQEACLRLVLAGRSRRKR